MDFGFRILGIGFKLKVSGSGFRVQGRDLGVCALDVAAACKHVLAVMCRQVAEQPFASSSAIRA